MIEELLANVEAFKAEAEKIFGFNETSPHRVAQLNESYLKLDQINAMQDDMLRQALRCIELGVFRGAHVLAWAALADFLQCLFDLCGGEVSNRSFHATRSKRVLEVPEHVLIDASRRSGNVRFL